MALMFSYGSNLNIDQMARRCPQAVPIGRFRLKNWRLVFRGVADCIPVANASCYGGVWRITAQCERALDSYEGVAGGLYRKEYIPIKETAAGETEMLVYCMNSDGIMPPSALYLEVIRQGFRDFRMPKAAWHALDAAVRESWDDKAPTHIERQRHRRKGRPTLAAYPEEKVTKLPAGRAHGLDRETIGDAIYAQHNAGPDFRGR